MISKLQDITNKAFFPHEGKTYYVKALDGLRGIAVLIVMLSHSSNAGFYFHEHLNFSKIGKTGVYLFFVLSAYLLDRQISLFLINGERNKNYWKNYFLRRFLRIYPLFALALIVYAITTTLGLDTQIGFDFSIPLHLALLEGKMIFWSIPVEFKYYFISPLLMLFFHHYLKWNFTYIIWSLLGITLLTFGLNFFFEFSHVSTLRYFCIFMVGMGLAVTETLWEKNIDFGKYGAYFGILGVLCLITYILTIPHFTQVIFNFQLPIQNPIGYLPYALLWGGVLIAALYGKGILLRLLEWRFLRFLGVISYSLYLFHIIFLKYVESSYFTGSPTNALFLFFLGSIVASTITYLIIEKPLSRIRLSKPE